LDGKKGRGSLPREVRAVLLGEPSVGALYFVQGGVCPDSEDQIVVLRHGVISFLGGCPRIGIVARKWRSEAKLAQVRGE
jgi:hypothetical protein